MCHEAHSTQKRRVLDVSYHKCYGTHCPWRRFVAGVPYHLGYGLSHPIALEGALKLKEITYAHCEGIFSSEFK
ncbi:MAG: hypothetical protein ACP5JJ_09545, partial [Anaerolineae bacterium]